MNSEKLIYLWTYIYIYELNNIALKVHELNSFYSVYKQRIGVTDMWNIYAIFDIIFQKSSFVRKEDKKMVTTPDTLDSDDLK